MSASRFLVTDTNPNDVCGGGGCVCSNEKVTDCVGPFAVFPATELDTLISPHVVIGAKCLRAATDALAGEVLSAGELMDQPPADELPVPVRPEPVVDTTADEDDVPEV